MVFVACSRRKELPLWNQTNRRLPSPWRRFLFKNLRVSGIIYDTRMSRRMRKNSNLSGFRDATSFARGIKPVKMKPRLSARGPLPAGISAPRTSRLSISGLRIVRRSRTQPRSHGDEPDHLAEHDHGHAMHIEPQVPD